MPQRALRSHAGARALPRSQRMLRAPESGDEGSERSAHSQHPRRFAVAWSIRRKHGDCCRGRELLVIRSVGSAGSRL
eukprot:2579892-Pyramimonas_sp.AAC.2